MALRSEWRGFKGTHWLADINVRDFIQNNYTAYNGDESFLEGPTEATDKAEGLKKAESDRWGAGVGYNYPLSKRTNVYAVAGYYQDKITNEKGVDGEDRDPSTTTVMLGMRHRF